MKNRIHSSLFKVSLVVLTLIFTAACNGAKKPEDTKIVAEEHNEAKFDNSTKEKDAQFLVNAAEIHLQEIQLGQIAQQNSNMSEVKELGKMMESEHGESLAALTTLAGQKRITIPTSLTEDAKDACNKLDKKSGKKFNNEYCDMMVKGHKDAIDLFEDASSDCSDSDVREWASSTLPTLRMHLDHAIACQKLCEKTN